MGEPPLNWALAVERVTGIEPALSAWESRMAPLAVLEGRRVKALRGISIAQLVLHLVCTPARSR